MQEDPLGFLAQTIMFGRVPSLQSSLLKIERLISCKTVGLSPPKNTVLVEKSNFFYDLLVCSSQNPTAKFVFPVFHFPTFLSQSKQNRRSLKLR